MFGDKRAEKKAKREQAKIKAKENPVIAILNGDGMLDHMILRKKTIIHTQSGEGEKPLGGVVARIESGRELESRIAITRTALPGALALAAPKRKGGEKFASIEGPDFIWCMEVDRKMAGDAARFVAKVNQQVKKSQADHCNTIAREKGTVRTGSREQPSGCGESPKSARPTVRKAALPWPRCSASAAITRPAEGA